MTTQMQPALTAVTPDDDHPKSTVPGGNRPATLLSGDWFTTEELARQLKVDPSTLRRWRTSRPMHGPPFIRLTDRVTIYSVSDVEEWLMRHRTVPGTPA